MRRLPSGLRARNKKSARREFPLKFLRARNWRNGWRAFCNPSIYYLTKATRRRLATISFAKISVTKQFASRSCWCNIRPALSPKTHALLALMLLNASRIPTRVDSEGNLLRLKEQDRTQWDQPTIARGMLHFAQSAAGEELSEYHLQAGIAACHCTAKDYESTDWRQILSLYDRFHRVRPVAGRCAQPRCCSCQDSWTTSRNHSRGSDP